MLTVHQEMPELNSQNRLAWVDVMRGAAILAVVIYHAHVQVSVSLDVKLGLVTVIDDVLRPFRMPVLMFLSGLLLPISLLKSGYRYLRGKFRKIAWPYIFWSTANLAVLGAASSVREETVGLSSFLKIFYAPPTYHWYLAYLFVFYLLALCLHRLLWLQTASIIIAIVIAYFVEGEIRQFLYLWAFFIGGDFIARHWKQLESHLSGAAFAVVCALVTAPALIISAQGTDLRYDPVWALSVFAAVFATRPLAQRIVPTRVGSMLMMVGRHSIVYYVVHYLVITIAFHILIRLGVENPYVLFVLTTMVALLVGTVLVRLRKYIAIAWLFEWRPSSPKR